MKDIITNIIAVKTYTTSDHYAVSHFVFEIDENFYETAKTAKETVEDSQKKFKQYLEICLYDGIGNFYDSDDERTFIYLNDIDDLPESFNESDFSHEVEIIKFNERGVYFVVFDSNNDEFFSDEISYDTLFEAYEKSVITP